LRAAFNPGKGDAKAADRIDQLSSRPDLPIKARHLEGLAATPGGLNGR
jgi:hypothetical protein